MKGQEYNVTLIIESSEKYKIYLENIVFDWAHVSDNIAYHLAYLEYLYQLQAQIPLSNYPVLHGLRIKTIITELASCAEVLLSDAINHLHVTDKWNNNTFFKLRPTVGFHILLEYAVQHNIIDRPLRGRLRRLFDHRHKIHLTHGERDPYGFTQETLRESEKTIEDLFKHFIRTRNRKIGSVSIDVEKIPLPWKVKWK